MISMLDLGWAAGFLEGEGWFGELKSPKVGAGQKEREPLDKLQRLFGGKITRNNARSGGAFGQTLMYWWVIDAVHSAAVMMTLYSLMSSRRQAQIDPVLKAWREGRNIRPRGFGICIRGHSLEGSNLRVSGKRTYCRMCSSMNKRNRIERLRG